MVGVGKVNARVKICGKLKETFVNGNQFARERYFIKYGISFEVILYSVRSLRVKSGIMLTKI